MINGAYIIARPVTIGPVSSTVNSISIGGTSNNSGTFSGLITTNQNFQVVQVATTGGNALNITGGITSNGNADTVTFNNAGNVNVASAITNGGGTITVAQSGTGTTTLTGANTYTGSTILNSGVFQLGINVSGSDGVLSNSSNVQNNAVFVYDYAGSQSYGGVISGAGAVTVEGSGTVALTGANTDSGTTNVTSIATLQLGNGTSGHDGLLGGNLQNNGVTTYDYAGSQSYAGSISGTGTINLIGTGTAAFSGASSTSGNVFVYDGDLRANNAAGSATGSGTVNISPNLGALASLSGTGSISGPVIMAAASGPNVAHLAPGVNSTGAAGNFGGIGTLNLGGGLTIGNGSALDYDLGTASDLTAVTGQLTLGTGVVLNVNQAAGFGLGTYTLLTYSGALTGNASSWTISGIPGADNATFASGGGVVTVTIAQSNNSTLVITPAPAGPSFISLGSVLVGSAPLSATVTGSNGGTTGTGTYALAVSGSVTSVSPTNPTLVPSGTTGLTVGAGAIGGPSGNNTVIGQISATNSANASGSLAPVNVTANIFEVFSGSTASTINSGTSAPLNLTNLANDDGAGGQRAGVTIGGYSTTNSNFVVTTDNGGAVGNATGGNNSATTDVGTVAVASNLLSGTYNYSGSVTGTAHYTDPALQSQGGGSLTNPVWTGIALSGTVTATALIRDDQAGVHQQRQQLRRLRVDEHIGIRHHGHVAERKRKREFDHQHDIHRPRQPRCKRDRLALALPHQ